jgi:hypothetical protein
MICRDGAAGLMRLNVPFIAILDRAADGWVGERTLVRSLGVLYLLATLAPVRTFEISFWAGYLISDSDH